MSPWGGSDSSAPASGHNGSLKAWNNLTKRMGFASADYRRSATQPTIQPINPPPIGAVKAALFSGLGRPRLSYSEFVVFLWCSCNNQTPAGVHTSAHTRTAAASGFRTGLNLRCLLCLKTGIFRGVGRPRDAVNTLLFSHPSVASQFPFISCLSSCFHATRIWLLSKSFSCLQGLFAAHYAASLEWMSKMSEECFMDC